MSFARKVDIRWRETCQGKESWHQKTLPISDFCQLVLQHPHTQWLTREDRGGTWVLKNSSVNAHWVNSPSQGMSFFPDSSEPERGELSQNSRCKVYNVHAIVQAFYNFPSQTQESLLLTILFLNLTLQEYFYSSHVFHLKIPRVTID